MFTQRRWTDKRLYGNEADCQKAEILVGFDSQPLHCAPSVKGECKGYLSAHKLKVAI